jgi:trans-aconitate methyltransferase
MKMNSNDNLRLQEFYTEALQKYGHRDSRSVRWSSKQQQQSRFKVLTYVADLSGKSVLDVGCGLGDLYKYMLTAGIEVDYTGIDIVPEFIEVAQHKFPDGKFECADIFELNGTYDYVLASGALSFKVEDNAQYYQQMIAKMYQLANEAVAFNMLDLRTHPDDSTYAAYSPVEIADYCSTIAGRVEMVTDYIPKDFTVFMYK